MILKLGLLNKSKILHFIDIDNKNICNNRIINKIIDNNTLNKFKLCKLCCNKIIDKVEINKNIFLKFKNILYESQENICINKKYGIIQNGYINIENHNINVNYIKINKTYYYLINNIDLYEYNDFDIYNIELSKKIGKLLGPKMAVIRKEMIIINSLKYNLWNL